jgi:carbonic anhydrase
MRHAASSRSRQGERSMQKLIDGLHHFQKNIFCSQRDLFTRLAEGQRPEALFITCSDSRINPNLITQTAPGDLFILRNAGNIVPPFGAANGSEAAAIEFAVAGLGVRDIILCGHTLCGAMRGLIHPETLEDLPAVRAWLSHAEATRRLIKENYPDVDGPARVTLTAEENVLTQLESLRTHPVVKARLARGDVALHGWMYKIETGEVFQYDHDRAQFAPIMERAPVSAVSPLLLMKSSI